VAEQLAFEERLRDGGAVLGQERLVLAGNVVGMMRSRIENTSRIAGESPMILE
jgi:hypothetical protein